MKTIKKKIQLLIVLTALVSACNKENVGVVANKNEIVKNENGAPLPYTTLANGYFSFVKDQSVVRLTSENELSALWSQFSSSPAPKVDF